MQIEADHLHGEVANAKQEKEILQQNITAAEAAVTGWKVRLHQLDGVVSFAEHLIKVIEAPVVGVAQAAVKEAEALAASFVHVLHPPVGAAEDAKQMAAGDAPNNVEALGGAPGNVFNAN